MSFYSSPNKTVSRDKEFQNWYKPSFSFIDISKLTVSKPNVYSYTSSTNDKLFSKALPFVQEFPVFFSEQSILGFASLLDEYKKVQMVFNDLNQNDAFANLRVLDSISSAQNNVKSVNIELVRRGHLLPQTKAGSLHELMTGPFNYAFINRLGVFSLDRHVLGETSSYLPASFFPSIERFHVNSNGASSVQVKWISICEELIQSTCSKEEVLQACRAPFFTELPVMEILLNNFDVLNVENMFVNPLFSIHFAAIVNRTILSLWWKFASQLCSTEIRANESCFKQFFEFILQTNSFEFNINSDQDTSLLSFLISKDVVGINEPIAHSLLPSNCFQPFETLPNCLFNMRTHPFNRQVLKELELFCSHDSRLSLLFSTLYLREYPLHERTNKEAVYEERSFGTRSATKYLEHELYTGFVREFPSFLFRKQLYIEQRKGKTTVCLKEDELLILTRNQNLKRFEVSTLDDSHWILIRKTPQSLFSETLLMDFMNEFLSKLNDEIVSNNYQDEEEIKLLAIIQRAFELIKHSNFRLSCTISLHQTILVFLRYIFEVLQLKLEGFYQRLSITEDHTLLSGDLAQVKILVPSFLILDSLVKFESLPPCVQEIHFVGLFKPVVLLPFKEMFQDVLDSCC
ncbi:hypothetical protein RCL1_000926 [Eukaryota sp. TZLM3-RCL]